MLTRASRKGHLALLPLAFATAVASAACYSSDTSSAPAGDGETTPSTGGGAGSTAGGGSSNAGGGTGTTGGGGSSNAGGGSTTGGGGTTGGGSPHDAGADAPAASGGAAGFLHTSGGTIVDSKGRVVRLTGLSWFGMETTTFAPHGLWTRSLGSMLDQVKSLGYNLIRIPYTNEMLNSGSVPNGIDLSKNPDLANVTSLGLLDKIVDGAKSRGLKIILDRHRPEAAAQSPLWYTGTTSEERWISDWKMLATHYKSNPTVVGFDLHNEPHANATWGDGVMATDWRLAAERAGTAVQAINPELLIIVEGVETAGGQSYWWGGNLRNAGTMPVRLPVANHLVYSPHEYSASIYQQAWFNDPTYPANLSKVWDDTWGYLAKNGTAPIWIGEFGTKNEIDLDKKWFTTLAPYIGNRGLSFAFWCLNPDSGDTGGILMDDWQTVRTDKQSVLQPILAPLVP